MSLDESSRPGRLRLAGRVCVITGTARGVGRAAARLFTSEGAEVIGVDVDVDGNRRTQQLIEAAGGRAHLLDGDVNDPSLLLQIVDHCTRHFGRVDVLFNNAVWVVEDSVDDVDLEEWDRVMDTNVKAPLRYTQALTPLLTASGHGSIINHSSIDGVLTNPHLASYSISKAALGGLTRASAACLADRGIRANAIASGNATRSIDADNLGTGFSERLLASESVSWARMFKQLAWNTPGQRVGTVEDLARVALFLASDDSAFVNGVSLLVDGGRGSLTPGTGLIPED